MIFFVDERYQINNAFVAFASSTGRSALFYSKALFGKGRLYKITTNKQTF